MPGNPLVTVTGKRVPRPFLTENSPRAKGAAGTAGGVSLSGKPGLEPRACDVRDPKRHGWGAASAQRSRTHTRARTAPASETQDLQATDGIPGPVRTRRWLDTEPYTEPWQVTGENHPGQNGSFIPTAATPARKERRNLVTANVGHLRT